MAIDPALWKASFTVDNVPSWPCPRCGIGPLGLVKDSLKLLESADSLQSHDHDAWEPEWVGGRFLCFLRCSNPKCHEVVACAGSYGSQLAFDDHVERERIIKLLRPLSFVKPPPVFRLPEECPEDIAKEVNAGFALLWSDPWSAANRIRAAIELLLDLKGIPRSRRLSNGRLQFLSLHKRIGKYADKCKAGDDTADHMMAVKWIGNAGAHAAAMTADDVLDGFALLELVLNRFFDPTPGNLKRLSRTINKKRGPLSSRRARTPKTK